MLPQRSARSAAHTLPLVSDVRLGLKLIADATRSPHHSLADPQPPLPRHCLVLNGARSLYRGMGIQLAHADSRPRAPASPRTDALRRLSARDDTRATSSPPPVSPTPAKIDTPTVHGLRYLGAESRSAPRYTPGQRPANRDGLQAILTILLYYCIYTS